MRIFYDEDKGLCRGKMRRGGLVGNNRRFMKEWKSRRVQEFKSAVEIVVIPSSTEHGGDNCVKPRRSDREEGFLALQPTLGMTCFAVEVRDPKAAAFRRSQTRLSTP
jgi:hypothetical protein